MECPAPLVKQTPMWTEIGSLAMFDLLKTGKVLFIGCSLTADYIVEQTCYLYRSVTMLETLNLYIYIFI